MVLIYSANAATTKRQIFGFGSSAIQKLIFPKIMILPNLPQMQFQTLYKTSCFFEMRFSHFALTLFYFLCLLGPFFFFLFQWSRFSANVNIRTEAFPICECTVSSAPSWKPNQEANPGIFAMNALMEERKQTSWPLMGA